MTIERRYTGGFDVILNDEHIDTVFFTSYTRDEAVKSLINHDGYDSNITVFPPLDGIIPLTERELEDLCDENEVTVAEVDGGWNWKTEEDREGLWPSTSKELAMRDAVDALSLDTNGEEDDAV